MKRWLGIDPGLAIIGWAVLEEQGQTLPQILDYGIIETAKDLSTPQRLLEIEQDYTEILGEFHPEAIAIEMPFFSRQIKAAGGVLQGLGILNLVSLRELNIEPIYLHQSSWKCHIGNAKADKREVATLVQSIFGMETMPIDDSVDAIAIAYAAACGLRNNI
ncbi:MULTISPECIES: crossover junction endodeoxyribonuclease RuvC [Cyanophyceae]|uniref:crossover junction endodeoxyribonuclease RuvC n=1 Tax=Cyanophyceae TaxID=3028117 RepID=UPI00016DC570|nr:MULTISPECIES: crossover junction endodeoxyribonuclease RuvC [Cyanophyceae]ACA98635.1 Holliday juction resolvase [Picosynechococcus sp. PCC 7002]SMH40404.1 crossover junction endodeoxyribonuclease RuvC [Picosynechococcus sp. OG1]SMQ78371.1 crossover junction endodeoxyribonuclease RuvC [Synechococcus sp. 7002]